MRENKQTLILKFICTLIDVNDLFL